MAGYIIVLSKKAEKQLDKLDDYTANPLLEAISGLSKNPRPQGPLKLKGRNGYRIIYNIYDSTLIVDVVIERKTPVTFNNIALTKKIIPSLEKAVGKENVKETKWVTGAEDFAYYGSKAPTVFLYYGGMPKGYDPAKAPPHHTPDFMISDAALYHGVKVFCNLVFDYPGLK
ncbi:MAG: hypothetical protein BGN92_08675 [Sphingobacteriales bacterium 41-5]|nr:MAG: hypothetical protein BGN92_08675 [Sphingobacteriales bacterium 41-5]